MKGLRCRISQVYWEALTLRYLQYRRYKKFTDRLTLERELGYWRSHEPEVLRMGENGYRLKVRDLGLSSEGLACLEVRRQRGQEQVIADIDRNGLLLSYLGPIENAPTTTQDKFLPRRRFQVQVVARDGYVGVRKSYRGSKLNFVNELKILHTLGTAGCHIPAIMAVDFEDLTITVSYIAGRVLKKELAARGAKLYHDKLGKAANLSPSERRRVREKRAQEGTRVLADVVDEQFIEKLYQELEMIHAAGVMDIDIHYGNIIVEEHTKQPYWIDFEHATLYPKLSSHAFDILCRRDISKFNLFFGTEKQRSAACRERTASQGIPVTFFAIAGALAFFLQ